MLVRRRPIGARCEEDHHRDGPRRHSARPGPGLFGGAVPGRPRDGPERGSALVLMPAAVLVFVVLGALCVDLAAVHLAQRELVAAAQGAANDAVTAALDETALYRDGRVGLDPGRARGEAQGALLRADAGYRLASLDVAGGVVVLVAEARVATIFARALPGAPRHVVLRARVTAALAP